MKTLTALLTAVTLSLFSFSYATAYTVQNTAASGDAQTLSETDSTQDSSANAALSLTAPSALLMEAETGTVLYEKNADEILKPASITKIMTMILIFDAINSGQIQLTDTVTVSEYAASMGGSQVFLEANETQTVETMLKCISIASANDACVAMAEYICGSEEAFVAKMNERAKGLGMSNTTFVNCCGLDTDGHVTTARDVALMSRELINNYPQIHDYCTIWMEDITHVTAKGESIFGLTNTNKLIRQYEYATGLKTGSTSQAGFCVSATATKDDVTLIAVIMHAADHKIRFTDATTLLNYGFSICNVYTDENKDPLPSLEVRGGCADSVSLKYASEFTYLDTRQQDLSQITKQSVLPDSASAPVASGDVAGYAEYSLNGEKIGTVDILYAEDVAEATFGYSFLKAFRTLLL